MKFSWGGAQDTTGIGLGPIIKQAGGISITSVADSASARNPFIPLLANGTDEPITWGNGGKQFVSQAGLLP